MTTSSTSDDLLTKQSFVVLCDGEVVPGVASVSALGYSVSADSPSTIDPIELTRVCGVDRSFEAWASEPSERTLTIQLLNASGEVALAFQLSGCQPITYTCFESLDAKAAEPAMECLVIRCRSIRSEIPSRAQG